MSDIAIRVENLSKLYHIGATQKRHDTLRDAISDLRFQIADWVPSNGNSRAGNRKSDDTIWALKDVSFEVKRGEVVGIIGRNGAGKSTLLKILSRITEPTKGRAIIDGRVGSLLEVGTGFHPELTGRENIYLNGAILGMKRAEIDRKFDEIVAFSEIEKFLDTPVKHYSSGMYVRLAFAVAAHLEPEILLVDEVLAVGDAGFQKKCLGKIGDVAKEGRTVLFVSHNMAAVQSLCCSAISLREGEVAMHGMVTSVIQSYVRQTVTPLLSWRRSVQPRSDVYIERIYFADEDEKPLLAVTTSDVLRVIVEFTTRTNLRNLQLSASLLDDHGNLIFGSRPPDAGVALPKDLGAFRAKMTFPNDIFLPRTYRLRIAFWAPDHGILDVVDDLCFSVEPTASFATCVPAGRGGLIALRCEWNVHRIGS
jgi:lipopolysaccharide transport system ATP-binding protein